MRTTASATTNALAASAVVFVAPFVLLPLMGWPSVVRLPALVLPAVGVAIATIKPWRWSPQEWSRWLEWVPTRRQTWWGVGGLVVVLGWIVLTRFQSGEINAVDFTVYFDRPAMRTIQGQILQVETADIPSFSNRTELAVHAYWAMVPLSLPYAVWPTPYWLLGVSVLAVACGAFFVVRIALHLGASGLLAVATGLSFALNDNAARALNYGFHPELLYALALPWFVYAGLSKKPGSLLCAALLCVTVKEDAVMVLAAGSLLLWLCRTSKWGWRDWTLYALAPIAIGAVNLALYYWFIVPALVSDARPTYSAFWATFGDTPLSAAVGMATHPGIVIRRVAASGFFSSVLPPLLFIPLIGWRATLGILPLVVIYGASDNERVRAYALYYSVAVTPFLAVGTALGAISIARWTGMRRAAAHAWCGAAIVGAALLVGSTAAGYSLRPWQPDLRQVPGVVGALPAGTTVLVQSGLLPFAGYERRVQLLTADSLRAVRGTGAVALLSRDAGFYPLSRDALDVMLKLPALAAGPGALVVVRAE